MAIGETVQAEYPNASSGGSDGRGDRPKKRRLSRSIRAGQKKRSASLQHERKPGEGPAFSVALADVAYLYSKRGLSHHGPNVGGRSAQLSRVK
jgi:hypothetical protein